MYSLDKKLAAINDFHSGMSSTQVMKKYNIKGTATIFEWIRRIDQFGIDGLIYKHEKTKFSYSFKIKVLIWRLNNQASYPNAARHFKIRNPNTIFIWERDLIDGRLNPCLEGPPKMTNNDELISKNKYKELEEENDYLKAKIAYLEKLDALVQRKKKFPTKKKHK